MKHLLLSFLFAISTLPAFTQVKKANNGKPVILADTTAINKIEELRDSIINNPILPDSQTVSDDATRNINNILELQKDRNAKQKKAAIIRIAIGIGFLLLLLIGLNRRRRMK
jgi:hypothetical protein